MSSQNKHLLETKNWVEALFYVVMTLSEEIRENEETYNSWFFSLYELFQTAWIRGNELEPLSLLRVLCDGSISPEETAIYLTALETNGYLQESDFTKIFLCDSLTQTEEEPTIPLVCKLIVDYIRGRVPGENIGILYSGITQ